MACWANVTCGLSVYTLRSSVDKESQQECLAVGPQHFVDGQPTL